MCHKVCGPCPNLPNDDLLAPHDALLSFSLPSVKKANSDCRFFPLTLAVLIYSTFYVHTHLHLLSPTAVTSALWESSLFLGHVHRSNYRVQIFASVKSMMQCVIVSSHSEWNWCSQLIGCSCCCSLASQPWSAADRGNGVHVTRGLSLSSAPVGNFVFPHRTFYASSSLLFSHYWLSLSVSLPWSNLSRHCVLSPVVIYAVLSRNLVNVSLRCADESSYSLKYCFSLISNCCCLPFGPCRPSVLHLPLPFLSPKLTLFCLFVCDNLFAVPTVSQRDRLTRSEIGSSILQKCVRLGSRKRITLLIWREFCCCRIFAEWQVALLGSR